MSVIAKAIAARQSEIERLQAEIKALNGRRQDPRDLRSGEASGSALLRAAAGGCGHPCRGDRVRRHTGEEAPSDDGQREGGGVRADESLLGRAQKESRDVARCPPPAALRIKLPHLRGRCAFLTSRSGSQQIPRLSDPGPRRNRGPIDQAGRRGRAEPAASRRSCTTIRPRSQPMRSRVQFSPPTLAASSGRIKARRRSRPRPSNATPGRPIRTSGARNTRWLIDSRRPAPPCTWMPRCVTHRNSGAPRIGVVLVVGNALLVPRQAGSDDRFPGRSSPLPAGASTPRRGSVCSRRSSNRTCRFTASGSRTRSLPVPPPPRAAGCCTSCPRRTGSRCGALIGHSCRTRP